MAKKSERSRFHAIETVIFFRLKAKPKKYVLNLFAVDLKLGTKF